MVATIGYEAMMLNEFKVATSDTYTNSNPSSFTVSPITSNSVAMIHFTPMVHNI